MPVPELPQPGEQADALISRIAAVLATPQVSLGVAGGEQIARFLIESAQPDAIAHILGAVGEFDQAGALDLVFHGHDGLLDHALNVNASLEHMTQGIDHLQQAFDPTVGHAFHFPVVTMLISSVREVALIADNKTSIERAVAHVAVDTGAAAAGGLGGAKLGALLGTAILPGVGTAIGGAAGAAIGAIAGRHAANAVKMAPLKRAVEEMKLEHERMESALTVSAQEACTRLHREGSRLRKQFEYVLAEAPSAARIAPSATSARSCMDLRDALLSTVEEMRLKVVRAVAEARAQVPEDRIWIRAAGLATREDALILLKGRENAECEQLDELAKRIRETDRLDGIVQKMEALAAVRTGPDDAVDERARACIGALEILCARLAQEHDSWCRRVAQAHERGSSELVNIGEAEGQRHRTELEKWRPRIADKTKQVEVHRLALGLA